ncbi:VOC family protein [Streptomyces sp. GMY01]|uniref:VOC family protein n=1 Tax=Streptomyces sp. GMY02 TaxID=1333528 RepID=UPI00146F0B41|nr:VOC family protein [Streptomyces sp. GMY02]NMO33347.1 VOC family protein [Streptomyces sp. GMY02]
MAGEGFTTCLWFDGQAEEAARYYVSVFDKSSIDRISHSTEAGPGPAGSVLAVDFTANGQRFMALNGGPQFTFSEAISFRVDCADQAEVDHYWATLTADGGEGGPCGWLKDKYGVSWQIVPTALLDMITDPDAGKASRTLRAMLAMGKLDLAALESAYAGE